jgi:hypothetical protein
MDGGHADEFVEKAGCVGHGGGSCCRRIKGDMTILLDAQSIAAEGDADVRALPGYRQKGLCAIIFVHRASRGNDVVRSATDCISFAGHADFRIVVNPLEGVFAQK